MKTIDEILDEWYPTIPDEEHNGLYARDKVKLIAQEFADQFRQPPVSGSLPCSKCGLGSHPVFGAQCMSDDCPSKGNDR